MMTTTRMTMTTKPLPTSFIRASAGGVRAFATHPSPRPPLRFGEGAGGRGFLRASFLWAGAIGLMETFVFPHGAPRGRSGGGRAQGRGVRLFGLRRIRKGFLNAQKY